MSKIYANTARILRESGIPITHVAQDTQLSREWLFLFRRERINNPGILAVETLHQYLTGKPLFDGGSK